MVVTSTATVLLLQVAFFVRCVLVFFIYVKKVFVLLGKVNHVVNLTF